MTIGSKEHYDIMQQFEKNYNCVPLAKEQDKELWKQGYIYQNGDVNNLFKAYRTGYSLGITKEKEE